MSRYRDIDRRWEYPSDGWKKKNSGAFLTWLKDENLDARASFDTKTGTIPYGVNNVDCVVNANVLFSLGLTGNKSAAGYLESTEVVADAIENKSWPECGTYYPQNMMFPYAISRAYRDGNVKTERLEKMMGKLLVDIIDMQERLKSAHAWGFSGGFDEHGPSLGMGLVTLNIGEEKLVCLVYRRYQTAVETAVDYLRLELSKTVCASALLAAKSHYVGTLWKAGTFSASDWNLVTESEPYLQRLSSKALEVSVRLKK